VSSAFIARSQPFEPKIFVAGPEGAAHGLPVSVPHLPLCSRLIPYRAPVLPMPNSMSELLFDSVEDLTGAAPTNMLRP
jgi:hypothetical protein